MLKWTATVLRQQHVSHDELVDVWEHVHAPHVVKIAKPERYRVTFFDLQDMHFDSGLDGMAELWFRDKGHFDTTVGREAAPEIFADRFNEYADMGKGAWLSVTEHVNVDGHTHRDMTYDGIAQLMFDSTDARFNDLQGFEPDGFGELVKPLLVPVDVNFVLWTEAVSSRSTEDERRIKWTNGGYNEGRKRSVSDLRTNAGNRGSDRAGIICYGQSAQVS